jgi:hypothetical protein
VEFLNSEMAFRAWSTRPSFYPGCCPWRVPAPCIPELDRHCQPASILLAQRHGAFFATR